MRTLSMVWHTSPPLSPWRIVKPVTKKLGRACNCRRTPQERRARAQRFETEKASSHGMSAAQTPTEATEAAGPTFPTILHVNLALRAS